MPPDPQLVDLCAERLAPGYALRAALHINCGEMVC